MLGSAYVYVPVSDFDKATAWYGETLGFEPVFSDPLYRELRSPSGIRIMLFERRGGVNSHMMYDAMEQAAYGFTVPDAAEIRSRLISKGVAVGEIVEYQGKSFHFTDPDGNVIELWEERK